MLKLLTNLRSHGLIILLIFALLFGQAMCDLNLPAYMSDLVNVGVQNGGIDEKVPDSISPDTIRKLLVFAGADDQQIILNGYQPTANPDKFERVKSADKAQLERALAKPMTYMAAIAYSQQAGMEMFPAGMDPYTLLSVMPPEQLGRVIAQIDTQLDQMPQMARDQLITQFIKAEYTALDMNLESIQTRYILTRGGLMLLIALAGMVASISVAFLSARVAAGFAQRVRIRFFTKVESFSNLEFDRFQASSLITRSTNDITQIQMMLVMLLRMVFYAPMMGFGGVIKVMQSNASMAWIVACSVGVLLILVGTLFVIAMPRFKRVQKLLDRINLIMREALSGLPVIRAFSTQKQQQEKFDVANKDFTKNNLFVNRLMTFMMPFMMLIMNSVTLLIVWFGAKYVDVGTMQIGDMMAFLQYAMQIMFSFLMLSFVSVMWPRASVAAQRINEVLDTVPEINDPGQPEVIDSTAPAVVEFDDVSFKYRGAEEYALENVSFTAEPGKVTAIIGSTGSGKSTIAALLLRFYDVTSGQVLVSGKDVRKITQSDLRDRVGYVPQKSLLFSGTFESNLKMANPDAELADMEKAADIACMKEFIDENEHGFEGAVAQGGTNVSGGQRQRMSIARAIVKRPQIFVFDDSFSALDFKTDAKLRGKLFADAETKTSTFIIVAQRVNTILSADKIIVLDSGKIVGQGTHKELLASCEIYYEIAASQLSKEELENE